MLIPDPSKTTARNITPPNSLCRLAVLYLRSFLTLRVLFYGQQVLERPPPLPSQSLSKPHRIGLVEQRLQYLGNEVLSVNTLSTSSAMRWTAEAKKVFTLLYQAYPRHQSWNHKFDDGDQMNLD